jgi:hypothetical protein
MAEVPGRARRAWLAAIPFALACGVAGIALDGSQVRPGGCRPLCQPLLDQNGLEVPASCEPSAPPASPPATHHDVQVFDSNELISV